MYFIAENKSGYYEFVIGTEDVLDEQGEVTETKDMVYRIPITRSIWCGTDKYGHGVELMGVDTTGWAIFWHSIDSNVDPAPLIACNNYVAKDKVMLSVRCPELAACCITLMVDGEDDCLGIDYTGDRLAIKDTRTSGTYLGMEDAGLP